MKVKKKYYLPLNATIAEKKLMEAQAVEDLARVFVRTLKYKGSNKQHAIFAFDLTVFDMDILKGALGIGHAKTVMLYVKRYENKMFREKHLRTGDKA